MSSNGQISPALLQQAAFILDACGRPIPQSGVNTVDIPAHIGYSRLMPGDGVSAGTEDIGGVVHKGRVPFMLRAMTAQVLPRNTTGVWWRLRFPDGRFFQSAFSSHSMAFGFGSDRQVFIGGKGDNPDGVEWKAGEKLYVDLSTNVAPSTPPVGGYTVVMQFEGVYRFTIPGNGRVSNPVGALANMPRYFLNEPQNILAPENRFGPGCPSEVPQGYQDETYWYQTETRDLDVFGAPVSNVQLQIEPTSDFICQEIWPYSPANTGFGSVVVRMRRGDGYAISDNFVPINSIQGPIGPRELKIKGGDTFSWDAYVVDGGGAPGSTITFGLYLGGKRQRKVTR